MFSKFANKDNVWSDFFAEEMGKKLNKEAVRPLGLQKGEREPNDKVYEKVLFEITSPTTLGKLEELKDKSEEDKKEGMNKMIRFMYVKIKEFSSRYNVDYLGDDYMYALFSAAEDVFRHVGLPPHLYSNRSKMESASEDLVADADRVSAMNVSVYNLLDDEERKVYVMDRRFEEMGDKAKWREPYSSELPVSNKIDYQGLGKDVPEDVDLPFLDDDDFVEVKDDVPPPLPKKKVPAPVELPPLPSNASLAERMAQILKKSEESNLFEEEYLDPEPASVDPGALETRHFHLDPQDSGVWGLDLDKEDLDGMHEDGMSEKDEKLQVLMDKLNDLSDEKLDEILALVSEDSSESLELENDLESLSSLKLPLSLKKRVKQ